MRSCGIVTVPQSPETATPLSSASTSSPLNSDLPSIASRVRTRTRLPEEATVVIRLRQRPGRPGRGHLDRVVAQQVAQMAGHPRAERVVHPTLAIQEDAQRRRAPGADHLHEQHLDIRLQARKACLDAGLQVAGSSFVGLL